MTHLRSTAVGIYVEFDPASLAGCSALLAYMEVAAGEGIGDKAEATALQALAEIDPGAGVKATASIALVEIVVPWPLWRARIRPPQPELFDEEGKRLAFVGKANFKRAHLLNDSGTGELIVARSSLIVQQEFLDVDHLLVVRSRYGLSDWCGVILEMEYTPSGQVTARLREALVLLSRWNGLGQPIGESGPGGQTEYAESGTPHALIAGSLARINARFETLVRVISIQLPTAEVVEMQHASSKSVLDEIQELRDKFDFDYWSEPYFDDAGRLRVGVYIANTRWRDRRPQIALWEGKHLAETCRYKRFSPYYGAEFSEALELHIIDTDIWSYMRLGDVFTVHAASLGASGIEKTFRVIGFEPSEDTGELIAMGYIL